jgi:D-glycero-D-manno-heptose 1,7-bisphosphate phosphatase
MYLAIPAKARIQFQNGAAKGRDSIKSWMPASAGMTAISCVMLLNKRRCSRPREKTVILDRDGVINYDSPDYIKAADEWKPIPGSIEAIARFKQAGWRVAIATNQAGLARGLFSKADLDAIHARMRAVIEMAGGGIDALVYCPHRPEDHCDCRKPAPGLLLQIARRLDIQLNGVPFIGDTPKDIEAARAAGARPVLVRTGLGEASAAALGEQTDVAVFDDLAAAADYWLRGE